MAVATEQRIGEAPHAGQPFGWHESEDVNNRINVGRMERWVSLFAGGALLAYAVKRRHTAGRPAALAAAALMHRGATGHCYAYQALGISHAGSDSTLFGSQRTFERGTGLLADRGSDTRRRLGGRRGIHVEEAVTINRPIAEVYRFWRNFENLPRFMKHLEAVSMREEGVSHWVARGPAGTTVEWDARIINDVDNQVIGWQSLEGSRVATAGSVNFDETDRGTVVRVRMQYSPPAGKLGSAVAWLSGEEPSIQIHDDLRRFKALLETGEIPTTEGQPSGRAARAHR